MLRASVDTAVPLRPSKAEALWARIWPWLMRSALLGLAYVLLFWRLGDGDFEVWDEGLYGQLARNALEHGRYLFAVDEHGEFSQLFSKPPVSIWAVALSFRTFGYSFFALRLPFALSCLAIAIVVYFWGRRLGGESLGGWWAFCALIATGTFRWGRSASIEPMFVGWAMLALFSYGGLVRGRSVRARLGWALLSASALTLAWLTKQLSATLAVFPLVAYELLRRDGLRRALPRLVLVVGLSLWSALVWFLLAYREVGRPLIERFFMMSIVERMEGFKGTTHFRTLNRVAEHIDEYMTPLPWVIGMLGLALWTAAPEAEDDTQKPGDVWLLLFLVLGATLVYGNLSKSMLPWYIYIFVPPLSGGCAFLLNRWFREGARLLRGASGEASLGLSSQAVCAATLGGATSVLSVVVGLHRVGSQVNAAVLVGLSVAFGALAARSVRLSERVRLRASRLMVRASAGVFVLACVAAALRHPKHGDGPDRFGVLMKAFGAEAPEQIFFDRDLKLGSYQWLTFFGPKAKAVDRPPWSGKAETKSYAFATDVLLPREYVPPQGVRLVRSFGATGFVVRSPVEPWSTEQLSRLLDAGPVTYEAEDLNTDRSDSLARDAGASGGAVRRAKPWLNEQLHGFMLSSGPHDTFPAGQYTAKLYLAWDCGGYAYDVGSVELSTSSGVLSTETLRCKDGEPRPMEPLAIDFALKHPQRVSLRVRYKRGTLVHDRTVIIRRGGL